MFFIQRRLVFLSFLLLFFVFFKTEALAISFKVDPSKIRSIVEPGGSQSGIIKVYSQVGEDTEVKVYLEDWVYTKVQDGTKDFSPAKNNSLSCASWVTFEPAEFILPAYGAKELNYIVHVPLEAKGGHYAVMFFEAALLSQNQAKAGPEFSEIEEMRAGTFLNIRLGTLFYVEAKGTVKRVAAIDNLAVSGKPKNRGLLISANFKNVGNVDITAGGSFHLIDKKGMVLARGQLNNVYTFPGDTAKLNAVWKEDLPQGNYDLILTLDLGKALEELEMGRGPLVTKEAGIEIGDNGEVTRAGELR